MLPQFTTCGGVAVIALLGILQGVYNALPSERNLDGQNVDD
jgi:hypothetical protein